MILYIINMIKEKICWVGELIDVEVVIIEIGGIVGDIEF